MIKAVKVHGIDSDYTTCDHCGKSNLKKTVVFEDESGQIQRYGTTCILKAFGKVRGKSINQDAEMLANVTATLTRFSHMPVEKVRSYIWNRFGYSCEIRAAALFVYGEQRYHIRLREHMEAFQSSVSWWAE